MANYSLALAASHRAVDLFQNRKTSPFPALKIPGIPLWKKGLERGSIAEIVGRRSSGRTSAMLHVLAQATQSGEVCAMVDTHNQFDPVSAARNGVQLQRLLWVRCNGHADHAIRAADLLLHAGGFGIVALDLCETHPKQLNKIPLSYWFRFRRAIESTPTILLVMAQSQQANSSLVNRLALTMKVPHWVGAKGFRLLRGLQLSAARQKPSVSLPESIELTG